MQRWIEKTTVTDWVSRLSEASKGSEKNAALVERIAELASKPRRQRVTVNLNKLDRYVKENENVIVPGKVLGVGRVSKGFNLAAVEFSGSAVEKLKGSKCKIVPVEEMVKKGSFRIII